MGLIFAHIGHGFDMGKFLPGQDKMSASNDY